LPRDVLHKRATYTHTRILEQLGCLLGALRFAFYRGLKASGLAREPYPKEQLNTSDRRCTILHFLTTRYGKQHLCKIVAARVISCRLREAFWRSRLPSEVGSAGVSFGASEPPSQITEHLYPGGCKPLFEGTSNELGAIIRVDEGRFPL